jgi:hypothetical protein
MYISEKKCFSDIPLANFPSSGDGKLNLYFDVKFGCRKVVTGWTFFAAKAGTVYLGVWRPQEDESGYSLIGSTQVCIDCIILVNI